MSSSTLVFYRFILYSILEPRKIPEVISVTRWMALRCPVLACLGIWQPCRFPGGNGISKVPTVIYYDQKGKVQAVGAETTSESVYETADVEGWVKSEWLARSLWNRMKLRWCRFKLHLRPNIQSTPSDTPEIPHLPLNKSVIEVLAHFFKYLNRAASDYIKFYRAGLGEDIWCSVEGDIHFVLSHPNGWAGQQQAKMRKAAVLVQLIPNTAHGYSRISFVTEGEAYLQFAIEHGLSRGVIEVITLVSHMGWCKLTQSSGRRRCYYCWCGRTYHRPERLLLQYGDWHCIRRSSGYPMYVCPHHQCFSQFIQCFKGLFQGSDSVTINAKRYLRSSFNVFAKLISLKCHLDSATGKLTVPRPTWIHLSGVWLQNKTGFHDNSRRSTH